MMQTPSVIQPSGIHPIWGYVSQLRLNYHMCMLIQSFYLLVGKFCSNPVPEELGQANGGAGTTEWRVVCIR